MDTSENINHLVFEGDIVQDSQQNGVRWIQQLINQGWVNRYEYTSDAWSLIVRMSIRGIVREVQFIFNIPNSNLDLYPEADFLLIFGSSNTNLISYAETYRIPWLEVQNMDLTYPLWHIVYYFNYGEYPVVVLPGQPDSEDLSQIFSSLST